MAKKLKVINQVAVWLITIGAINWGLDKFLDFNIVDALGTTLSGWVYGIVALSGVYGIYLLLTGAIKK